MSKSDNHRSQLKWFPKEWKIKKLGELYEFKNGVNAGKEAYGKGVKFVNVMDVFGNTFISHDNIIGSVSLSEKQKQKNLLEKGDVLFNRTSEVQEEIGMTALYNDEKEAVFGGFVIRGRSKSNELNQRFSAYGFQSEFVRRQIIVRGQGAVRVNIGQSDLEQVKFPIPPRSEQKEIICILAFWDEAITNVEKLIKAKKRYKRGLMQRLLSGKVRFPEFEGEDWVQKPLGKLVKQAKRKVPKPDDDYLSIGIRSHGKGTFQKPDKDPQDNSMTSLYKVKENDLIVNITFAWEGAIAIVKNEDKNGYVSHRFPTYEFDTEKLIPEYFQYVIVQPWFVYKLGLISPGGAGRNRVLNKKDFLKLKVEIPSVSEQKAITDVLTTVDNEIELLERQLKKYQKQKKGLIQKLLTGKVRVK